MRSAVTHDDVAKRAGKVASSAEKGGLTMTA